MIEQLLTQFLEHLRYERNVSEHTLRNYASDLQQFHDFLAPVDPHTNLRNEPQIQQIDHLTIREWLSTLHSAQKKKSSVARKLAALRTFFQFLVREGVVEMNPAKLVSTPRLERKLPKHLSIEDAIRFIALLQPSRVQFHFASVADQAHRSDSVLCDGFDSRQYARCHLFECRQLVLSLAWHPRALRPFYIAVGRQPRL